MQPDVTGLPLEEAEALLRAAGEHYILTRTEAPFAHPSDGSRGQRDYALRYDQGELTYASFPVLSVTVPPREEEHDV